MLRFSNLSLNRVTRSLRNNMITFIVSCLVFLAVLITGVSALCVSSRTKAAGNRGAYAGSRRTTKRGELFNHPIFVSQAQNLGVVSKAVNGNTKSPLLLQTDSENKPKIEQARAKASSAGESNCEEKLNTKVRTERKKVTQSCIVVTTSSNVGQENILLTVNNAYGSSTNLTVADSQGSDQPEKLGTGQQLIPCKHVSPSLGVNEITSESNPSYPIHSQESTNPDDEIEYSYIPNSKVKSSTWPHGYGHPDCNKLQSSTTIAAEEVMGIYVDLDIQQQNGLKEEVYI